MKTKLAKQHIIALIIAAIAVLVGVIMLFRINSMERKINEINASMSVEETEAVEPVKVTELNAKEYLAECKKLGDAVAKIQNDYTDSMNAILHPSADADIEQLMRDQMDIISGLGDYFTEGTEFYGSWYAGDSAQVNSKWEFAPLYRYSSAVVPCIWLCTDVDTNRILAYAVGRYSVNDKLFSSLNIYTTYLGNSIIPATDEGNGILDENLDVDEYANSIMDMISKVDVGPSHQYTDEELKALDEVKHLQEADRRAYEESKKAGN